MISPSTIFLHSSFSHLSDYAYIADEATGEPPNTAQNCNRHSLSTFVNVSNVPTPPFSMIVSSNTLQPLSNNLEPEPYATTDILRAEKEKMQQHHYAVNTYAFSYCLTYIATVCLMGQPPPWHHFGTVIKKKPSNKEIISNPIWTTFPTLV